MNCLKCGRQILFGQVFCEDCQAEMEHYPVKPDTVVQLPPQTKQPGRSKRGIHRRPALPPEEQERKTARKCRWLTAGLIAALVLAAALAFANGILMEKMNGRTPLGKNYSTVVSTQPQDTAATEGKS